MLYHIGYDIGRAVLKLVNSERYESKTYKLQNAYSKFLLSTKMYGHATFCFRCLDVDNYDEDYVRGIKDAISDAVYYSGGFCIGVVKNIDILLLDTSDIIVGKRSVCVKGDNDIQQIIYNSIKYKSVYSNVVENGEMGMIPDGMIGDVIAYV